MINLIKQEITKESCSIHLTDDDKPVYITIDLGMIYVDHHEPAEMQKLISDDYLPDEAYDTVGQVGYFMSSKYHMYIIAGLLRIANNYLTK